MTIGISTTLRNSRLQLVLDAIDDGADEYSTASLLIYSGDRPATGEAIDEYDNILLVDFPLGFPSGTITDGILTFEEIADQIAIAYGIAEWARIVDMDGTFVADLLVTNEAGSGDVKINDTEVFEGGIVHCHTASITEGNE